MFNNYKLINQLQIPTFNILVVVRVAMFEFQFQFRFEELNMDKRTIQTTQLNQRI